jgi:hypothetical protein
MAFYMVNGSLAFWPDGEVPPWPKGTYTTAADPNAAGVTQQYLNSPAYAAAKAQAAGGPGGLPRGPVGPQQPNATIYQGPRPGGVPSGVSLAPSASGGTLGAAIRQRYDGQTNQTPQAYTPSEWAFGKKWNDTLQPRWSDRATKGQDTGTGGQIRIDPRERSGFGNNQGNSQTGYGPRRDYVPWDGKSTQYMNDPYGNHPNDPANYWKKPGDLGYATRDEMYAGRSPWLYAYNQGNQLRDYGYNAANPYKTVENDPNRGY